MDNAIQGLIFELEQEAATTRGLLNIVPEDKFAWRPHAKSKSLGELAFHIASIPGSVSQMMMLDGMDAKKARFNNPSAESMEQLLNTLDSGVKQAKSILGDLSADAAKASWKLSSGDREVFSIPRMAVARTILLNHWYHHRGQLTVYLRLLEVPLPVVYGRSADTNPFAD